MPRDETDLERAVFGGSDSELSSDEGEDIQQNDHQPPQRQAPRPPKAADRFESSGADSEDDYVHQDATGPKKKRMGRKKRGEEGERRVAPKKRKRKQLDEEELKDLPPEQANKLRREAKLDDMIRGQRRGYRPRKKKGDDLDAMADEEIARLREAMNNAADEDMRANSEKLPATSKLKLLPEAMDTLRKASLAQSMIDNNLLEAVKRWLEPLPDGSLPALNIQRELFGTIKKMEFIDSAVLKESGLGRIVLFYTKCKRVTLDVSRIANDLVSIWSRPIIKRSASYRDRVIPQAQSAEDVDMRAGERLSAILARAKEQDKNRVRKNAVMIPQRSLGTYTVAPKDNTSRVNVSVVQDTERRRKHGELLRSLTRRTGGT